MQIQNDYGTRGFGGACPPKGHGIHHYRFTVHALSIEKLELPEDASGALAGYMINAHTIESTNYICSLCLLTPHKTECNIGPYVLK